MQEKERRNRSRRTTSLSQKENTVLYGTESLPVPLSLRVRWWFCASVLCPSRGEPGRGEYIIERILRIMSTVAL